MTKFLKLLTTIALIAVIGVFSQTRLVQANAKPTIYFEKTEHTFPTIFEGDHLSYTFTVFNKGTDPLNIKDVTTS